MNHIIFFYQINDKPNMGTKPFLWKQKQSQLEQCYSYFDGCDIWYNFFDAGRFTISIYQEKKCCNQKKKRYRRLFTFHMFALTKMKSNSAMYESLSVIVVLYIMYIIFILSFINVLGFKDLENGMQVIHFVQHHYAIITFSVFFPLWLQRNLLRSFLIAHHP